MVGLVVNVDFLNMLAMKYLQYETWSLEPWIRTGFGQMLCLPRLGYCGVSTWILIYSTRLVLDGYIHKRKVVRTPSSSFFCIH